MSLRTPSLSYQRQTHDVSLLKKAGSTVVEYFEWDLPKVSSQEGAELLNSLSAKSVLAGEKLVATYSIFYVGIEHNILCETKTWRAKIYLPPQCTNRQISHDIN